MPALAEMRRSRRYYVKHRLRILNYARHHYAVNRRRLQASARRRYQEKKQAPREKIERAGTMTTNWNTPTRVGENAEEDDVCDYIISFLRKHENGQYGRQLFSGRLIVSARFSCALAVALLMNDVHGFGLFPDEKIDGV
jgi:hypothetical protein